jgi:hypothetical protein
MKKKDDHQINMNDSKTQEDKRSEARLKKSMLAFTISSQPELLGVISNVSKHGFLLESRQKFEPGTEISLLLAIFNKVYNVKCEIRWSHSPVENHSVYVPCQIGARITEAPAEYLNYIEYQKRDETIN